MKKLLIASLSTFVLWISTVFASEIPVSYINTLTNDCSASNTYHNFYLEWTETVYPYDRFYDNTKDIKINPNSSLIKIWKWNWVISNCDDWYLLSNVVPKKSSLPSGAYIWESPCDLNIPNYIKTNSAQVDAQINYTVWYNNKKNVWWTQVSWKFFYQDYTADVLKCYPSGIQVNSSSSCSTTNFRYWNLNIHTWECVNFRVFWCGDGLVNWYNWNNNYDNWYHQEQCDPKDPNHTNWWLYGCTETCEKNDVPPVVQPDTTCNITLSADEINLWESATINYQISWAFNSPTYMEVAPSFMQWSFPYAIYCNTANNCQFTQWSTTIAGTSIPWVWTYTFTISWQSPNWDFSCQATLHVKSGTTPPPVSAPTCNITLSSNEISLWESATINYQISWAFNSPTYMEVSPSFIQW